MSQFRPLLLRVMQAGGLLMLLCGLIQESVAQGAELKRTSLPPFGSPSPNLVATSVSIAQADADTIKRWLLGDLLKPPKSIWGIGLRFGERIPIVLAQPNAKLELAQIIAREDLPPEIRVYAQEILITGDQQPEPSLVEAYCYALRNSAEVSLYYEPWGMPDIGLRQFGITLIRYRQLALPCLSRLLEDNKALLYAADETGAISTSKNYRVSDLAAYLITKILQVPYNQDPNPAVRDQQIQDLRRRLAMSSAKSFKRKKFDKGAIRLTHPVEKVDILQAASAIRNWLINKGIEVSPTVITPGNDSPTPFPYFSLNHDDGYVAIVHKKNYICLGFPTDWMSKYFFRSKEIYDQFVSILRFRALEDDDDKVRVFLSNLLVEIESVAPGWKVRNIGATSTKISIVLELK